MTTPTPAAAETPGPPDRAGGGPTRRGPARFLKPAAWLVAIAAAAVVVWRRPDVASEAWRAIAGGHQAAHHPADATPPRVASGPWDGAIVVAERAREAMGIRVEPARPQSEPIRLELLGTTEYISDTLTKVRPMFEGRVDKVYVTVGESVRKGDPLIDLYSTELAAAKSVYEIEKIQWLYDKKLLEIRESLLQSKAVSQQLYDETRNNEMKNRREYEVARDKLLVYGLTEQEVEGVESEPGSEKARLTLRSPADGLVIDRDVAVGNLYDENDTLLVVTPLERLWVWGNVFESDLDLVSLGQSWEIRFPFLGYTARGKVEYISNRVDPSSHAVRVRASIPNPEGKLKSDMLVRGLLEIPPVEGRVEVPRTALVVVDGLAYVFVEVEGRPDAYERRDVTVAHEKEDHAVLERGLKAGERVVVVGGLLLQQIYENEEAAAVGAAPGTSEPGRAPAASQSR
ncbi:efflux RND transporter periplasmic adaptor subunit [Paludisphaera soli]|uniref:efflux RND transporter periplasmic adaptor subunit n=1 Tax=Paludisphaera soli TaxID=2712865 RepID=UPI00197F07AC|nr:efflux RND transporter periplasmic adaptor subunit [Paludisphaera soli]